MLFLSSSALPELHYSLHFLNITASFLTFLLHFFFIKRRNIKFILSSGYFFLRFSLTTRHGLPYAITLSGISLVTTLPAPMTVFWPMVTPGKITVPPTDPDIIFNNNWFGLRFTESK